MDNSNKHTANFLVSLFLKSKISLKYVNLSSHCSIMRYIADAIDFYYRQTHKKAACFSRKQISVYSRCSETTVKTALKHFVKKRIFKISHQKGWHSIYEPGDLLLAYAQRKLKLSPGRATIEKSRGNGCPTSDIDSDIKAYNKGNIKKEIKSKSTNQKEAIRKLAKKLGLNSNH
jgi:hypothetical protein